MDITFLTPAPASSTKGLMPMGKGVEGGFIPPGMEKLAPPGAAPPLIPGFWPMGEEGAKLEPNAPTQSPDFFPNVKLDAAAKADVWGTPEETPADGKETFKKDTSRTDWECLIEPQSRPFALLSAMGPILVASSPIDGLSPAQDATPPAPQKREEPIALPAVELEIPTSSSMGRIAASNGLVPATSSAEVSERIAASNGQTPSTDSFTKGGTLPMPPAPVDVAGKSSKRRGRVEAMPPERLESKTEKETPVPVPPQQTEGTDKGGKSHRREDYQGLMEKLRASDHGSVKNIDSAIDGFETRESKDSAGATSPKPPELLGRPLENNVDGVEAKSKGPQASDAQIDADSTPVAAVGAGKHAKEETPSDSLLSRKEILEAKSEPRTDAEALSSDNVPVTPSQKAEPLRESVSVISKPKIDLSNEQSSSILRQVADRLEALAAGHASRKVTIHLDPESFGSITLVVRQRGSEVDTEVYASHDSVRAALESHRPALSTSLEQRGIQLGSMTVGHELPHDSGRQEQAMREAAKAHANMAGSRSSLDSGLSLESMRELTRKSTGIDLWT